MLLGKRIALELLSDLVQTLIQKQLDLIYA